MARRSCASATFVLTAKLDTTTAAAATVVSKRDIRPPLGCSRVASKEGLGSGRTEQQRRAPQRGRDEGNRDIGRGPPCGTRKTRPREDEKAHGDCGEARRERRDQQELRAAVVQLLKVHQEDGEAIGGEHVVVERRRAGWVDVEKRTH